MEILTIYAGLSGLACLVSLVAAHFAPVGYEDETGFHYGLADRPLSPAQVANTRQVLPAPA
jgi:hypothetical protein